MTTDPALKRRGTRLVKVLRAQIQARMNQQGWTTPAIASWVSLDKRNVYRFLSGETEGSTRLIAELLDVLDMEVRNK